jgi:hypothetical protein
MRNSARRLVPIAAILSIVAIVILTKTVVHLNAISNTIVISQVYGGGGNSGATLKNDFIELFNRGNSSVSLTGWSVQYASTAGSSWQVTSLSSVTLAPGQYYLVQEAVGAGGTTALPTPDAIGTIAMAAGAGKVALVNGTTALSGACPAGVVDVVGYGTGTTCFEGAGPTATLTNTTAALRAGGGCTDTDVNSADFSSGAPNPRNTTSAVNSCGGTTNPTGNGSANPSSVTAGASTLLTVAVTPGANPASTGLVVSANLTAIGGAATQQFFDDGTQGDVTAGDNIFSFQATVPAANPTGPATLTAAITDAQSRSGSASIALTVTSLSTPPTGVGAANPNSLLAGASTLLTVHVAPGTNPASSSFSVVANLSTIGGSASQQFLDDGLNGDVTAGDKIFSFQATITSGTSPGAKSLTATIADDQPRSSTASIALTVQSPPPPATVKISQVYGGGGNSGATYTNDFIEIYNQASTPIDVSFWSVQEASATASSWAVTNLCTSGTCVIAPGHYYLVQESAGAGGTTPLPAADATGGITMSATSAKVALVAGTTALTGTCPTGGAIVDFVGYGGANCSETTATPTLDNLTAAVRKGNGCVDTDNNLGDFVTIGPIPRNSVSPANSCGGDPTQPSGLGLASPASLDPASNTVLKVIVTPATTPPSTGVGVVADLSSLGGSSTQQFFDNGTNGDAAAGDNVFSFEITTGAFVPTGVKNVVATVTDGQGRTATAPITLTISSPTCGVERWSVKTGTDPDASLVNLLSPVPGTIVDLGSISAPADPPGPPLNARIAPTETNVYVFNATMTLFKKETDVDYHIVLQDSTGRTLIAEIPSPACVGATSPFAAGVAAAREKFDNRLTATPSFQPVSIPVQVKGVGFFDFIHGQTGVAPNGIELHPLLEINFTANSMTTILSSANPSQYLQPIDITVTVSNGGASTPGGSVSLFDGGIQLGSSVALDASGHAAFAGVNLQTGVHQLTVSYGGDSASAPSLSAALAQTVNKADQSIQFGPLGDKTFGDAPFDVSAATTSGLLASFAVESGSLATISGNTVTLTGAGAVSIRASQAGDGNYNAAPDAVASFTVKQASQTITLLAVAPKTYGDGPVTVTASGGGSHNPVTFGASGNCTSGGENGATITITGAGSCTVTASQAGNTNYKAAPDASTTFTIGRATPSFSDLTSPGIGDGVASVALSGTIRANTLVPTGSVTVTLNTVTQSAVVGADGRFSSTFTAPRAADVPYVVDYHYSGDANFNAASGQSMLTVSDTTPPIIAAHGDVVAEATSAAGAIVTYTPPATMDHVDGNGMATCSPRPGAQFAMGLTVVTCNASDAHGNAAAPTTFTVTVVDTTKPSTPTLAVDPGVLWPPNSKFVPVVVTAHSADAVSSPVCSIVGITKNDKDGRSAIAGPLTANLLAVSIDDADELVYTLSVSCRDTAGNVSAPASINVIVPHDQGKD